MTFLTTMVNKNISIHGSHAVDAHFARKYPMKILIVEDMEIAIRVLDALLHSLGYEPSIARGGVEAVKSYAQELSDFIIMDIQMPEMDGIEATKQIREFEAQSGTHRSYILALTADIQNDHRPECFAVGMDDYLHKPIQKSQLCEILIHAYQSFQGK